MKLPLTAVDAAARHLARGSRGYFVALAAISIAVLLRLYPLDTDLGQRFPLALFMAAVVVTAWIAGFRAGLFAIGLSLVAAIYLDHKSPDLAVPQIVSQLRMLLFVAFGGVSSYSIAALHVSRRRLEVQQLRLISEMKRRKEAEEALRVREERIRMAVESADIGTWDLNPETGARNWSDRSKAMFGLPLDTDVTDVSFLDWLHPDDRDRTRRAMQAALAPNGDGRYESEYRVVWPDETVHWCIAKGQALFEGDDDARRCIRFIGTVFEITDRRLAEDNARKYQEVLKLAQSIGRMGHWEWNALTDENKWSPEIEALYGLPPGSFEGSYQDWANLVHPDDLIKAEEDVQHAFETGEYFTEFRVVWPDGSVRWLETRAKVFKDDNGRPLRIVGVNMDITERKKLEEELKSLNAELAEADRRKDEFLATLAHELRNPLTPISNALQVWSTVEDDPIKMKRLRSTISRQTEQMTRLIDDLLDISRITSGKMTLRKEHIDLGTVVTGSVESIQPLVEAFGHQLNVQMSPEPILVDGDAVRLMQVFGNVLNNAAKFTGRDGTLSIALEKEGDRAVVRVRDNGPGIPHDMLLTIFETFRQIDGSIERSYGGLGIGLTLAKRLTEMHSGTIEAYSEGLGRGSEFVITLPALNLPENGRTAGKSHAHQKAHSIPRRRILVVDDMPEVADSYHVLFDMMGQEAVIANDGETAIELALAERPNIVFLDIAMPGMSGYDVARQLRSCPELEGITLVALTGYGQAEDEQKAVEAGFDHHLAKPTNLKALRDILATVSVDADQGVIDTGIPPRP